MALWGLVILFGGMVIGAGITFHAGQAIIFRAITPSDEMALRVTEHIARDLGLTDEQRPQVAKIVTRRVSAFKSIFMDAFPGIKEQFELLRDEVAPKQREERTGRSVAKADESLSLRQPSLACGELRLGRQVGTGEGRTAANADESPSFNDIRDYPAVFLKRSNPAAVPPRVVVRPASDMRTDRPFS